MPAQIEQVAEALGMTPDELVEHQVRTEAGLQAMAEPVPGQVRDALLQRTPIKAGAYSIRACEDGDIELLSLLEHPMNELRLRVAAMPSLEGDQRKQAFEKLWSDWVEKHQYRGPMAWQLCFIFTHSGEEVDGLFDRGGLDAIRRAARSEFRKLSPRQVMELAPVCMTQYLRSWNTMLSYEAAEPPSEGEIVVKKNSSVVAGHSLTG